jgi:hypothetical protein
VALPGICGEGDLMGIGLQESLHSIHAHKVGGWHTGQSA